MIPPPSDRGDRCANARRRRRGRGLPGFGEPNINQGGLFIEARGRGANTSAPLK